MKLKTLFKLFISVIGSLALLYAGRVAGIYALSVILEKLNLTGATYADAPAWMRFLADNGEKLVNILAFALVLGFLLYMMPMFRRTHTPLMFSHLFLGIMGTSVGVMLVKLLISLDCVREGGTSAINAADYALDILLITVNTLLLRGCVCAAIQGRAAAAVSALLQAGAYVLAAGTLNPVLIINGAILGGVFALVFERTESLYPELLLSLGFRIGSRRIMGFPDIKAYTVSEPLLTGGSIGLEAGLLLTGIAVLCGIVFMILKKRRIKE